MCEILSCVWDGTLSEIAGAEAAREILPVQLKPNQGQHETGDNLDSGTRESVWLYRFEPSGSHSHAHQAFRVLRDWTGESAATAIIVSPLRLSATRDGPLVELAVRANGWSLQSG